MKHGWVVLSSALLVVSAGCNDDGEGNDPYQTGSTITDGSGTEAGSAGTASSGDTGEATGADDGTTGPSLDIPDDGDGGIGDDGNTVDVCQKVDVLYVIDNSPSMYDEQQTLIANFGTFASEMQTALEDVEDYHVGVITTDNYIDEGFLDDSSPTVNAAFPECRQLGAMVVQSQSGTCTPFAEGNNYITSADDLATKFACIANVGEDGDSDERVGDALIQAVNPSTPVFNGCNAGFLRDDALLVIVILTDENDASDAPTVEWFANVVAAKAGQEENVVVLALIWDDFASGCEQDLSESTGWQIEEFAEMFPNHAVGNICESSYAGFFSNAIPTIDSACDNFIPPG